MAITGTITSSADVSTEWWNGRKLVRKNNGELWCCYNFYNPTTTKYEIRCAYSANDGLTWTEEIVVADASNTYNGPTLAIDRQGNLHLAYGYWVSARHTDNRIKYRKRTTAWSDEEEPETHTAGGGAAIAIDSIGDIHLAYEANHPTLGKINIRYIKKTSAGWQTGEWVSEISGAYEQHYQAIALDSQDNIHVVWEGTGWGTNITKYQILYRKRTSSGWETTEEVTDSTTNQWHPNIAIDKQNNVHLAWAYGGSYRKRTSLGWGDEETIPFTSPSDLNIAVDLHDKPIVIAEDTISGVTQLTYSQRNGAWSIPVAITSGSSDNYAPIMIWARQPGYQNRPKRGFALIFYVVPASGDYLISYYSDVAWNRYAGNIVIDQLIYQHAERMR